MVPRGPNQLAAPARALSGWVSLGFYQSTAAFGFAGGVLDNVGQMLEGGSSFICAFLGFGFSAFARSVPRGQEPVGTVSDFFDLGFGAVGVFTGLR